jgi:cytochrome c biogenesis protein CcmG/thiol:disulfide interchange protein DsbE
MTSKSRASRREAARQTRQGSRSRWLLPVAGAAVAAVAVLAVVLSQAGRSGAASSAASSASPPPVVVKEPTITGTPLPKYTSATPDPAKGLAAPVVEGYDYAGKPVSIAPNGKPTMVLFAAHWCPHCQREIPVIQAWLDSGKAPADVNMVSVSTAIDPSAPNYPPEAWFEREGWTVPLIVDPTNTVAKAYGLASYPYFVILDGSGKVFGRLSGEIPVIDLERILAAVPRS